MKNIIIGDEVKGSVAVPEMANAYTVFHAIKKAYAEKRPVTLKLLFSTEKIKSLGHYQKGGAQAELAELQLFIDMGRVLGYDTAEAEALRLQIELTNDNAHVHLNISKRTKLLNKQRPGRTRSTYLFWDIENFGPVGPMFSHIIEKFRISDDHVFLP